MTPVQKALWYIENQFDEPFSLDDVACASGVSRYHLIRAFGKATNISVMQYVKRRRLTEAAKSLASSDQDIISVAITAGYQSHEAFTRAFRSEFGLQPSRVRNCGGLSKLSLLEPIMVDLGRNTPDNPEIENISSFVIHGLQGRFDAQSRAKIPSLWKTLTQSLEHRDAAFGTVSYGASMNYDETGAFDYLCGLAEPVRTYAFTNSKSARIPSGLYAKFLHTGHISSIRESWNAIYNKWLPHSDYTVANSPEFECYSEDFNPITGTGNVSIHLPVRRS